MNQNAFNKKICLHMTYFHLTKSGFNCLSQRLQVIIIILKLLIKFQDKMNLFHSKYGVLINDVDLKMIKY